MGDFDTAPLCIGEWLSDLTPWVTSTNSEVCNLFWKGVIAAFRTAHDLAGPQLGPRFNTLLESPRAPVGCNLTESHSLGRGSSIEGQVNVMTCLDKAAGDE